jgi:hypothetical protein
VSRVAGAAAPVVIVITRTFLRERFVGPDSASLLVRAITVNTVRIERLQTGDRALAGRTSSRQFDSETKAGRSRPDQGRREGPAPRVRKEEAPGSGRPRTVTCRRVGS